MTTTVSTTVWYRAHGFSVTAGALGATVDTTLTVLTGAAASSEDGAAYVYSAEVGSGDAAASLEYSGASTGDDAALADDTGAGLTTTLGPAAVGATPATWMVVCSGVMSLPALGGPFQFWFVH